MGILKQFEVQFFQTIVCVISLFLIRFVIHKSLRKIRESHILQKHRIVVVTKSMNLLTYIIGTIVLFVIWRVDKQELILFVTSTLAFLGIAFFAQWSMLSNITAGIILFINHPARIGDTIQILDLDVPVAGKIRDIGVLFMTLRTEDGDLVTIPNNLVMQKLIKIVPRKAN